MLFEVTADKIPVTIEPTLVPTAKGNSLPKRNRSTATNIVNVEVATPLHRTIRMVMQEPNKNVDAIGKHGELDFQITSEPDPNCNSSLKDVLEELHKQHEIQRRGPQ